MQLTSLLFIPIIGVLLIYTTTFYNLSIEYLKYIKSIALISSIIDLIYSLIVYILYDYSNNQFQFVQEHHEIGYFDIYLGLDGISIYFVLLTTIIIPISLLSNYISIKKDVRSNLILILLLETLLLAVFLVLDILMFYIFFESILPPLFILIGIFGSNDRVKASFFLFLYTLLGSLFLLLSIVNMSSTMGTTDLDSLLKTNFNYIIQFFLFCGVFIAFAVKTPVIFLNIWLLKAHVESPLSGSIILAGIVLKLSLYGVLRIILPFLTKAFWIYTFLVYVIGVTTIAYASISTLRTTDVKELIAYSSVSHAAVYLLGVFSNTMQGIEGGITLGLAHGFVSSGLFICAGGVLYDRCHTRLISYYRGMTQLMPLFSIMFFLLSLANCGVPLTLNFTGEFLSLYGIFERLPYLGILASFSIIFSAAYTIYMFNRISFGGSISKYLFVSLPDLTKREFYMLVTLVVLTFFLGIYSSLIMDGIHYSVSTLIYSFAGFSTLLNLEPDFITPLFYYFQDSATPQMEGLVELHDNILFYLVIILFTVGWMLISIYKDYINKKSPISYRYLSHGTLIELIWTITPALILMLITFPSFKLLYLMDEVSDPSMVVLAEDHQWYLSYQYPDHLNSEEKLFEFYHNTSLDLSLGLDYYLALDSVNLCLNTDISIYHNNISLMNINDMLNPAVDTGEAASSTTTGGSEGNFPELLRKLNAQRTHAINSPHIGNRSIYSTEWGQNSLDDNDKQLLHNIMGDHPDYTVRRFGIRDMLVRRTNVAPHSTAMNPTQSTYVRCYHLKQPTIKLTTDLVEKYNSSN